MKQEIINCLTWYANRVAETVEYDSWSNEFCRGEIREANKIFVNEIQKHFDFSKLTRREAIELGFGKWDDETDLYLIPLYLLPVIPIGIRLTSINGDTVIYDGTNIDNDIRFGCLAWGIKFTDEENSYLGVMEKHMEKEVNIKEFFDQTGIQINDIGEVSDGFHTFNSLYHQRLILFAALCKAYPEIAWKSKRHDDGEIPFGGGWFIVGIETPKGQYTYHYKLKDWDLFKIKELDLAPKWDGHTDKDVERLLSLC